MGAWICLMSFTMSSGCVESRSSAHALGQPRRDRFCMIFYFRIPWKWDSSAHAVFTSGEPWMRVNEDYQTWNVAKELKDNNSIHSFWNTL